MVAVIGLKERGRGPVAPPAVDGLSCGLERREQEDPRRPSETLKELRLFMSFILSDSGLRIFPDDVLRPKRPRQPRKCISFKWRKRLTIQRKTIYFSFLLRTPWLLPPSHVIWRFSSSITPFLKSRRVTRQQRHEHHHSQTSLLKMCVTEEWQWRRRRKPERLGNSETLKQLLFFFLHLCF